MTERLAPLNACAMGARSQLFCHGLGDDSVQTLHSHGSVRRKYHTSSATTNRRLTLIHQQAPKKEKKDLDDEDKAFLERKRAGTLPPLFSHYITYHMPIPSQTKSSKHLANAFLPEQQRRRPARSSPPRPAARVPSTPVPRASRSPARSKLAAAF